MPERFEGGCLSPNTGLENPMLVMSSFRAETHVAQQSRRDKLRVQHSTSTSNHSIQDFQASMLNSVADPDHHPRSLRNYDIVYDPSTAIFSSEMLNFTSSAAAAAATEPSGGGGPSSIENNHHLASHSSSVPASCSYWNKGPSPSQTPGGDWNLVSYASGNQGSQLFVGGVKEGNNISSSSPSYIKPPPYSHLHDLSTQEGNPQKQHYGELHYNPTVFYQNAIPDVVPSSSSSSGFEMAGQGSWVDAGNELLLLPSFGNVGQTAWMNRPTAGSGGGAAEGSQQWVGDHDFVAEKREGGGGGGLSLSLSSHSPSDLRVVAQLEQSPQDSKTGCLGGYYCSYAKSPVGSMSRSLGNSLQSIIVGSSSSDHIRRGGTAGPLGPFTGYATILKNSKFLKPAQQLLDELCSVMGPKRTSEAAGSDRDKGSNASMSCDTATNGETEAGGRGGNSGVSTCSFYSSTEGGSGSGSGSGGSGGGDGGNGGSGGGCQHFRPEFHKKKAKLLYMQEEVCRRYKQYHQQMQMVLSSFESVVGLSSATPYASLGLKAVSKHFRCLKNAISEQLKSIGKALGEEFMSASTSKSDALPRLRFIEQSFRKPTKAAGENLGFLDHQPHVWRPQRGLPERSVAVLRAWLFEHFLHPYPTDTDKHMLATQTGLSRNQVSNWFINARVRVWKPMVEEIHMLETKGSADMDLNSIKRDGKHSAENVERANDRQQRSKLTIEAAFNKQSDQSVAGPANNIVELRNSDQWHQDKRSRMADGCQMPAGVDGGLIGFLPYQGGIESIGGLGAVSLTLGLRHSAESLQQQQQQQQLRHFGVHDFTG